MNDYCKKVYGWYDSVRRAEEYVEELGLCTKDELKMRALMDQKSPVISDKYKAESDILYFLQNVCYIKRNDLTISPIKMTPQFLIAALLFEAERPFIIMGNRQMGNTTFLFTLNLWHLIRRYKEISIFFNNKTIAKQERERYINNLLYPTVKLNTDWFFSKDVELSNYYGLFYDVSERNNPIDFTKMISGIALVDCIPSIINNDPGIFKNVISNKNISGIITNDTSINSSKYFYLGLQNDEILDMIDHRVSMVDIGKDSIMKSLIYDTVFIR